ncbi:reverse transcriptase [Gossypium australe]|uniref:Reverse transcriptase n=1 Tax=Gossypium australe TaxID=47621 RepID=A0A5B6W888_9ROSI|nr:reverse transcriptase [Gossypium australe]
MILYKIISKPVANRFQQVLDCCIDEAQSAFVLGRLIIDNVLLAYEVLAFKQKRTGRKGFLALKLDINKVYDRVEWSFIRQMMLKMGFASSWVEFIINCISSVSYSTVVNGKKGEVFCPTRGIRQGDPLSPYLFLVCSEGLLTLMRLARQEGLVEGARVNRRCPQISHLMLLMIASYLGVQILKDILKKYGEVSRQCVNYEKSIVFYSSNTSEQMRKLILQNLNGRGSTNLEKYLGLPNMIGPGKKMAFQLLKDHMKSKIDSWSIKYLSQGGKDIFIKFVRQAILTIFGGKKGHGRREIHWCEWKKLCELKGVISPFCPGP